VTLAEWLLQTEAFDNREFFGPVADSEIEHASREIGLPLPAQYREFLSVVGCGSVAAESFIGLGGPQDLDVVWMSKALRSKDRRKRFPADFIPLRADGYGNYDAIDTSRAGAEGEFLIVEWRHEGSEADPCQVLATSYFAWLESMLDIIREGAE
jgi:hypothetical protein